MRGYDGPPNGRVRDVPDRRTIRYYTTLGLLDPPAEMKGRTVLYGRRHLLQLVAIKQLQARGQSLAEVQRAWSGSPMVPLSGWPGRPPHRRVPPASGGRSPSPRPSPTGRSEPPQSAPSETLQGVRLAESVTLLLARPAVEEGDLEAIRVAATPLLAMLDRRRLIPRPTKKETP